MFISAKKNSDSLWDLSPLSGPLADLVIAVAEGVSMKDVEVNDNVFVGTVLALWGAEISDIAYHDTKTLNALGIGKNKWRSIDQPLARFIQINGETCLIDNSTSERILQASFITILNDKIYYER